jgi:hypothetical protein
MIHVSPTFSIRRFISFSFFLTDRCAARLLNVLLKMQVYLLDTFFLTDRCAARLLNRSLLDADPQNDHKPA